MSRFHPPRAAARHGGAAPGFTLIELTVVLGLLAGFLVFLTQLLSGGVALFEEGEAGQELADLSNAAARAARDSVVDMTGPERDHHEPGPPAARLLAQWVPLGNADPSSAVASVQALRATVRLSAAQETELLTSTLRPQAEQMAGSGAADAVAARLADLLAATPRRGQANMLLLPWPSGDQDGAFLELRKGLFLFGQPIVIDRRRQVGLMEVERLDALPAELVKGLTTPIAAGLLHVEFAFWSQYTRSFDRPAGDAGPEYVWDSARAGWLAGGDDPRARFSLDLAAESLENTTDDVYPRHVRITLVVASEGREARLAEILGPGETRMVLRTTDPLPDLEETPFLKVGAEWVRHGGVSGNGVTGLWRGVRGTRATEHPRGTRVRAGKTIQLHVELMHGRDNWNG